MGSARDLEGWKENCTSSPIEPFYFIIGSVTAWRAGNGAVNKTDLALRELPGRAEYRANKQSHLFAIFSFSHIGVSLTSTPQITTNPWLTHVKTATKCQLEGADLGWEIGPRDSSAHLLKANHAAVPVPGLRGL